MNSKLNKILRNCGSQYGMTIEEIKSGEEIRDDCFYKCVFEGFHHMDEEGTVNYEKIKQDLEDVTEEEEEAYRKCDEEYKDDRCAVAKCITDITMGDD